MNNLFLSILWAFNIIYHSFSDIGIYSSQWCWLHFLFEIFEERENFTRAIIPSFCWIWSMKASYLDNTPVPAELLLYLYIHLLCQREKNEWRYPIFPYCRNGEVYELYTSHNTIILLNVVYDFSSHCPQNFFPIFPCITFSTFYISWHQS